MTCLYGTGRYYVLLLPLLVLSNCAGDYARLDTEKHHEIIQADKAYIDTVGEAPGPVELSLDQAMERAIHYNLDARVSALEVLSRQDNITLEELRAFPSATFSAGFQGRSNKGASSSQSIITGTQSLEPSISSQQYRRTMDLGINWNMIDVALAAMQTSSAKDEAVIAQERHSKVLQNIQRDVYSVYWRAYVAQKAQKETRTLFAEAEKQLADIDRAVSQKLLSRSQAAQRRRGLEDSLAGLKRSMEDLALADQELKSLLSYSPDTKLTLTTKPNEYITQAKSMLEKDPKALELTALENRPEMRETIAQRNITLRDTQMEMARTFPGLELFYAFNQDSNKFLEDHRWKSFSASIVQSITSLITAPKRIEAARNKETLEEARRISLAAAIVTQVHLARVRLAALTDIYETSQKRVDTAGTLARTMRARKQEGFASGADVLAAELDAQVIKIQSMQDEVQVQEAAAALMNSLGTVMPGGMS